MESVGRSQLVLEGISHRFQREYVLREVSVSIDEGEFVTLLGPSGCGKTTLLRVIAGFIQPTQGRVVLEGRDWTGIPAYRRPVNMVFQRPTLFPHLDVFENVSFGLRMRRIRGGELRDRVTSALRLVRLEGFERRKSHELSGGQMQRVTLARALVNRPRVLLLDEPLSALDLRIRLEMEAELRRVHRETQATFVYVTHDQREALALSDRIVVMEEGVIDQVGAPSEIYHAPSSTFTARFVGGANVIPVDVVKRLNHTATVALGDRRIQVPIEAEVDDGAAWLVIRPEAIRLSSPDDGLVGIVQDLAFRGAAYSYTVDLTSLGVAIRAELGGGRQPPYAIDDRVGVAWDEAAGRLLPRDGEPDRLAKTD